jgi:hypothetical protein
LGLLPALVAVGWLALSASPGFGLEAAEPGEDVNARLRHFVVHPQDPYYDFFPITNYFNTAFDTAQVSRAFSQRNYFPNHGVVLERIFDAHDSIEADGGYGAFFKQEFASSALLPNLTLHLLGNGYDFRVLSEWYDSHNVPFPFVWAFLTSYAGYLGNEAIEVSNREIDSFDHIADLYFFNLVGNLVFTTDTAMNFAQNVLRMRNWTGQPMFDVRHVEVMNASNNYVLRPQLWGEEIRPFLYFGLQYLGGLSIMLPDRTAASLAIGVAATDPFASSYLDKVRPAGGLFWDKGDRLRASVIFNGTDSSLVRANLYPELFRSRVADVGFFLGMSDNAAPAFGISVHKLLALGFR